jgi:hypothetical protein
MYMIAMVNSMAKKDEAMVYEVLVNGKPRRFKRGYKNPWRTVLTWQEAKTTAWFFLSQSFGNTIADSLIDIKMSEQDHDIKIDYTGYDDILLIKRHA